MSHEVYAAKDFNGNYLYVGSGKEGRHKHCKSGVSHCYDLNRLHHNRVEYLVEVLHKGLSKQESLKMESSIISKHRPKFNKAGNKHSDYEDLDDLDFNNYCAVEYYLENQHCETEDDEFLKLILDYTQEGSVKDLISKYLRFHE